MQKSTTEPHHAKIQHLEAEIISLNKKIEKLQFHMISLATLVGNVIDKEAVSGSIQELSVLLNLSKEDLRTAQKLISEFEGDIEQLQTHFVNPNGNLHQKNLPAVVQAFANSGILTDKCEKILGCMADLR